MRLDVAHQRRLLPYADRLGQRRSDGVDLVVIHCTELPDLETARRYGEAVHYPATGTGNSGHVYIDRNGTIELWVDLDRVAHHTRGYNQRSVGIELVNLGRYPDWHHSAAQTMKETYPDPQIEALIAVIGSLERTLPSLQAIAGHEDLDRERIFASDDPSVRIPRKLDPGPLFPWPQVLGQIGLKREFGNAERVP